MGEREGRLTWKEKGGDKGVWGRQCLQEWMRRREGSDTKFRLTSSLHSSFTLPLYPLPVLPPSLYSPSFSSLFPPLSHLSISPSPLTSLLSILFSIPLSSQPLSLTLPPCLSTSLSLHCILSPPSLLSSLTNPCSLAPLSLFSSLSLTLPPYLPLSIPSLYALSSLPLSSLLSSFLLSSPPSLLSSPSQPPLPLSLVCIHSILSLSSLLPLSPSLSLF